MNVIYIFNVEYPFFKIVETILSQIIELCVSFDFKIIHYSATLKNKESFANKWISWKPLNINNRNLAVEIIFQSTLSLNMFNV